MKRYSKTHEWVEMKGAEALLGITEYAAKELGDITFVELPPEGTDLIMGDKLGTIESVKAASDIYCPVSSTICELNTEINEAPAIINTSAEGEAWLCRLNNIDLVEFEDLMTKEQYDKFLKETTKKK